VVKTFFPKCTHTHTHSDCFVYNLLKTGREGYKEGWYEKKPCQLHLPELIKLVPSTNIHIISSWSRSYV